MRHQCGCQFARNPPIHQFGNDAHTQRRASPPRALDRIRRTGRCRACCRGSRERIPGERRGQRRLPPCRRRWMACAATARHGSDHRAFPDRSSVLAGVCEIVGGRIPPPPNRYRPQPRVLHERRQGRDRQLPWVTCTIDPGDSLSPESLILESLIPESGSGQGDRKVSPYLFFSATFAISARDWF